MRRSMCTAVVLSLLTVMAACGSAATAVISPTPTTSTEVFPSDSTATLTPNGAATYPFTALAGGTVTATLTTLVADSGVTVGMSLGTWNGSACQSTTIANDKAVQGTVITGTVTAAGSLCARVYDASGLAAPVDYQITVVHP